VSVEEFLRIVHGLPEVVENDAFGGMSGFRVRGKGFCYLNEAEGTILVKATREEQAALTAEEPDVFRPSYTSGRFGWLEVEIAGIGPGEMTELVTEAWRLTAPKRLSRTLDPAP
jgi:hypothetical protein